MKPCQNDLLRTKGKTELERDELCAGKKAKENAESQVKIRATEKIFCNLRGTVHDEALYYLCCRSAQIGVASTSIQKISTLCTKRCLCEYLYRMQKSLASFGTVVVIRHTQYTVSYRTRGSRLASGNFTTKPMMLL